MDEDTSLLITVTGRDRPGLTSTLCHALEPTGAQIVDMEQVVVRGRLLLGIVVTGHASRADVERRVVAAADGLDVEVECKPMSATSVVSGTSGTSTDTARLRPSERWYVVVLGQRLAAGAISSIADTIAACGFNIDRIARLSRYPIVSFELLVSGRDGAALQAQLAQTAADAQVDVAVQRATLYRRAKRLIVLDVDSTLIQGEVIEMLAERVGCAAEVADITERAMTGEIDFAAALRERIALLRGLPESVVHEVAHSVRLTPGARTLIRTLRRLGFTTAAVSGGFTQVTDHLQRMLHLDFIEANSLEVEDGVLTGRLSGPIIDRSAKAAALRRFADAAGVPLAQTVAVGDGANDLDMLLTAGLGIAFNAKPIVRRVADTAVSVPYLDVILFLLGITREEIEAADAEDAPDRLHSAHAPGG